MEQGVTIGVFENGVFTIEVEENIEIISELYPKSLYLINNLEVRYAINTGNYTSLTLIQTGGKESIELQGRVIIKDVNNFPLSILQMATIDLHIRLGGMQNNHHIPSWLFLQ